jgi:hypothetical protein
LEFGPVWREIPASVWVQSATFENGAILLGEVKPGPSGEKSGSLRVHFPRDGRLTIPLPAPPFPSFSANVEVKMEPAAGPGKPGVWLTLKAGRSSIYEPSPWPPRVVKKDLKEFSSSPEAWYRIGFDLLRAGEIPKIRCPVFESRIHWGAEVGHFSWITSLPGSLILMGGGTIRLGTLRIYERKSPEHSGIP